MTTDQEDGSSPLEPVPMQAVPPPERRTRAGRNLPAAIGVGLALGAVVLLSLYLWKPAFVGVVVAAIVLAAWELTNAFGSGRIRVPVVPLAVGAAAIIVSAYAGGSEAMVVALALTVFAMMLWRSPENPKGYVRDVTAATFAALYLPFLAGFAVLLLRPDDGPNRVVVFIVLTVLSDVGGYVAGVLFGKHPMAPTVSPKKSWEGFAGSAVACVLIGVFVVAELFDLPLWQGAAYGGAVVVAATVGDLGESMIKRDLGIKDMGTLLPGHGGLMDRLDSLVLVDPIAWAPA